MSLVAWLPLNGNLKNQGVADITISGTPSYTTGKLGKQALNLSTRVTFNIPSLVGAKTWSVSFWCITNNDDTLSSDWVDIMGMHDRKSDDSASGEFRWETCYGATKGSVAIGQYNNATYATMTTNGGTLQGTKGGWHHCIASTDFENGTVSIYLDGVLKYTKVHAGGWLLGDFWLGQNNAVNGAIQDVRIYNHALSKREIKELSKGLILHYALKGTGVNPNLQPNSQTFGTTAGNPNNFTHETKTYEGQKVIRMTCKTDNYSGGPYRAGFTKTSLAVVGKTYTWSMYIRANTTFTMTSVGHECGGTRSVTVTPEWQYVTKTWAVTDGTYTAWVFYGRTWALGDWIEVKNFKVEEGSIATPYIPNSAETIYTTYGYNSNVEFDVSGHGFNGTKTSCGQVDGSPRNTTAIDFTANTSHLTIPKALSECTELTTSIWVKFDEDTTASKTRSCNVVALGTNEFFRYRLQTNETALWVYWNNGASMTWDAGTSLIDGNWHHVVTTFKAKDTVKLYVDGVQKQSVTTTLTKLTATNSWKLGEYNTNSEAMDGKLSDFRLYATALSADDVKALYQNSVEIDKTGKMYCGTLVEV